ncbi:MAG: TetR/AcrR family transcriptional regulator [Leptolyngbya sp. SIO1D8]|nr:TetR/AcrR family transcriptional regulator [Leptolyngbya sp. SIO1D8]
MSKGKKTRQDILHKVAILFNEKGYVATSMQDITAATGIKRGGIYNHFISKEALALEAFEYAYGLLSRQLLRGMSRQKTAVGRLNAIAYSFAELYIHNPSFPSGCQVLNTAVEAKRQMLPLRQKAQMAMRQFQELIVKITCQGIAEGELPDSVDAEALAAIFVSVLEGGMLLTVLYDDATYLKHAVSHLQAHLDHLAVPATPTASTLQ